MDTAYCSSSPSICFAVSKFLIRDELWPDFDRAAFEAALAEYGERRRRFGGR